MSAATPPPELTEQERRIVDHLRGLNGRSASYREIANAMGWASVRAVGYHVEKLAAKGIVEHGQHRGLRLVGSHAEPPAPAIRPVLRPAPAPRQTFPILGEVAAGEPIFGDGPPELLDMSKVFRGEDVFFLRVRGDSMIDKHIASGDLIAVQRSPEAVDGRIMVVRIDGGHTLKVVRLDRRTGQLVLWPCNAKYQPRVVQPYEDAEVIGGFIGVLRFTA